MASQKPLVPYVLFEANPPELPVRQAGDKGGPEVVVKASIVDKTASGLLLTGTTLNNEAVRISISIAAPGVARVLLETADSRPDRVRLALAQPANPAVTIREKGSTLTLETTDIVVQVTLDPFGISFLGPDGTVKLKQDYSDTDVTDRLVSLPFGYTTIDGQRVAFHETFTAEPDEHYYGFGEKFTDFDKRGQRLKMWHYDAYGAHSERAYKNVPFYLSSRGYGVFVDSIAPVEFDMAASSHASTGLIVPDSALDYYVICGPDQKSIITRYAGLVSYPILPPKWSLGLWMSSGFEADSADSVLDRAKELRANDIPCDVLHLDCFWQKHGRWSDMQWDTAVFPDPAGLLRQVKEQGFRVCLWINSYIGIESPLHTEGSEKGYFLKAQDGTTWVGDLWGGESHFHPPVSIIDITNPEAVAWFEGLLRPPLQIGADVYKTDFGEGIPPETVAWNGMSGTELHNYYPLLYNDIVAKITVEETDNPGLVWGRSTYAGGQRHAAQWGGDPNCTYQGMMSTLRGGLSMGVCGHAFWSHDIGGFHFQPTPEVFIRWAQFGLFSPLTRAHGMSTRLPWDYGEEAHRIFQQYAKLRYSLLPYIYSHSMIAHQTSLPIIRAMVVEFPDDPLTHTMDLQYMFGSELLVAPIYNDAGNRPVYLPAGQWVDFWTNEVFTGPQTLHLQDVPLDILPLYVRADALIPTIEPPDRLSEEPFANVTFDAYLLNSGCCELHDTDGTTTLTAAYDGSTLVLQLSGAKSAVRLRLMPLPDQPIITTVQVNGQTLTTDAWAEAADGTVHITIG